MINGTQERKLNEQIHGEIVGNRIDRVENFTKKSFVVIDGFAGQFSGLFFHNRENTRVIIEKPMY